MIRVPWGFPSASGLFFHCCGPLSLPIWGTEFPQATWHSWKRKKKKKSLKFLSDLYGKQRPETVKVNSQPHTNLRGMDYTPGHWRNNWTSTPPRLAKAKPTEASAPSPPHSPPPQYPQDSSLSPRPLSSGFAETRATFWLQWWRWGLGGSLLGLPATAALLFFFFTCFQRKSGL